MTRFKGLWWHSLHLVMKLEYLSLRENTSKPWFYPFHLFFSLLSQAIKIFRFLQLDYWSILLRNSGSQIDFISFVYSKNLWNYRPFPKDHTYKTEASSMSKCSSIFYQKKKVFFHHSHHHCLQCLKKFECFLLKTS